MGATQARHTTTQEASMASVTFEHVIKKYGDVLAVNDLNLDIRRYVGERLRGED